MAPVYGPLIVMRAFEAPHDGHGAAIAAEFLVGFGMRAGEGIDYVAVQTNLGDIVVWEHVLSC